MPQPTTKEITHFLRHQAELFNALDMDGFIAAFKAIAPGGFKVEDPAGSPQKQGWDILEKLCSEYAGWKLYVEDVKVSGNEAAIYVRNEGVFDGHDVKVYSIEHYIFGDDGSLLTRYFHPNQEEE